MSPRGQTSTTEYSEEKLAAAAAAVKLNGSAIIFGW